MSIETVLRAYFDGEKSEAALILLAGGLALLAALWLWFSMREPFARGLAAALLLVAALGLTVGGTVYFRTDAQVRQLVELQQRDPARFATEEGSRIQKVIRSFGQYRVGYAVAVVLAMVFVFAVGRPLFQGLAVGLLLLAALGLTIDFYAERRAVSYERALASAGLIKQE